MDNIKTWTGLHVEELIRMTEDRDKWRKYVHGVANPRIEAAEEQNIDRHLDICDDHMERLPTILTRRYRPNFPEAYASVLCRHCCGHIVSCRLQIITTRSSAIAEGPLDSSCQLKSCQLPRNSAETTYTTSPD